jgi:hypothetical protein
MSHQNAFYKSRAAQILCWRDSSTHKVIKKTYFRNNVEKVFIFANFIRFCSDLVKLASRTIHLYIDRRKKENAECALALFAEESENSEITIERCTDDDSVQINYQNSKFVVKIIFWDRDDDDEDNDAQNDNENEDNDARNDNDNS